MRFFSASGEFGCVLEPPAEPEARNAIKKQD
jgi:hypothetical protein